eukprot:scaffold190343_cov41-Prasinocladus_malaysianus.AAC.1
MSKSVKAKPGLSKKDLAEAGRRKVCKLVLTFSGHWLVWCSCLTLIGSVCDASLRHSETRKKRKSPRHGKAPLYPRRRLRTCQELH